MPTIVAVLNGGLATIIAALIAAFCGSAMAHFLTARRETRGRRREAEFRHLERQIEELYGPLAGLVRESTILFETALRILPSADGKIALERFDESDGVKWRFLIETFWFPLNQQIIQLLRAKVHLLEGDEMPASFDAFIRHAATFEALHRLWKERNERVHQRIDGVDWPPEFSKDIQSTLRTLKHRYDTHRDRPGKP